MQDVTSGWQAGDKDRTCPTCAGVGKVDVPDNATKCARCKGSGWQAGDKDRTCPTCRGTGYGLPIKYY